MRIVRALLRTAIGSTLVGSLVCGGGGAAFAQATVDKWQYTLCDPVPDSALRSFNPDRPTKAFNPYTVDAGHFQYEMDLINYAYQKTGTVRTNTILAPNPTLKLGITNNIDFELNIAPFEQVETKDVATGISSRFTGPSDLFLRSKINLWGNDGGKSAFALIPYVKAPTAPNDIGNGAAEGGIIAPLSFSLPNDFTLLFNSEIDILKNSLDNDYHAGFINLVNLSKPIIKDVTLYVELWSDVIDDPAHTVRQYSFDTAIAWTVRANTQIDIGANFGLNSDTPAIQVYAGLAQRF